jgi:nitrous oxidase accessory protein NosD
VFNGVSLGTAPVQVDVIGCDFSDNLRSIMLSGDDVTYPTLLRTAFRIEANRFTGFGANQPIAHLGIFILTGAGGQVRSNLMTGFSYRGATGGFSGPILAHDGRFTIRGYFVPVQPIRFEGNRFLTNDHHIVMVSANQSEVVGNLFHGTESGWIRWGGLAFSGTNVVVARNEFTDLPIGIELFGGENNGSYLRGVTSDTQIVSNRFCAVQQAIRAQPMANGVVEQASEFPCPPHEPQSLHVPGGYPSVQAAVDAAKSGDTIHIAAGDYYEQIIIANKGRLTLMGETGAVLHATTSMTETLLPFQWSFVPTIGVFRSDVTVRNVSIEGHRMAHFYNGLYGIYFLGASGRVENCSILGFRSSGTTLYGAAGVRTQNAVGVGTGPVDIIVKNCVFDDNENAVHLRGEPVLNPMLLRTTFSVETNTVTGVGPTEAPFAGITIRNGASGVVRGNTIRGHTYAGTANAVGAGIAAYDDNAYTTNRSPMRFMPLLPIRFEGNTFSNNSEHLVLVGANDTEVSNNIFEAAGPSRWGGVVLGGSTNCTVSNNDFAVATKGVVLFGPNDYLFSGWPAAGMATAVHLAANWFCNVAQAFQFRSPTAMIAEQGTEFCPFKPVIQGMSTPGILTVRSWHGDVLVIETSTDVAAWVPVHTNLSTLPCLIYEDWPTNIAPQRFYRVLRR